MLEVRNIKKSFAGTAIIEGLNLNVKKGEFVSVMGISGSGKTTLFNIIAGLMMPDHGQVFIGGRDITGTTGHLSYMQQDDLLFPWKTVLDNVSIPLILKGEKKETAREKARGFFELFGIAGYEDNYPDTLSGGMRQRAALLRTYLFSSDYVLLDEPFARLDAITKNKMRMWLSEVFKKLECGMLFITHDVDEALLLSDRIYILSGRPAAVSREIPTGESRSEDFEVITTPQFNEKKREIIRLLG